MSLLRLIEIHHDLWWPDDPGPEDIRNRVAARIEELKALPGCLGAELLLHPAFVIRSWWMAPANVDEDLLPFRSSLVEMPSEMAGAYGLKLAPAPSDAVVDEVVRRMLEADKA